MSLLDQLTTYSYHTDSFFSQLDLPPTPQPTTNQKSQAVKPQNQKDNVSLTTSKEQSQSCQTTNVVSLESIQPQHTQSNDYYEKYKLKFKIINAFVSLLSAKTRKIKYQFMIQLERAAKKTIMSPPSDENKSHKTQQTISQKLSKLQSEPLVFSIIGQTFFICQNKILKTQKIAFQSLKKHYRRHLKIQLFYQLLSNMVQKNLQQGLSQAFSQLIKLRQFKKHSVEIFTTKILQPLAFVPLRSYNVKTQTNELPFLGFSQGKSLSFCKPLVVYPQNRLSENIDFCDTLPLFVQQNFQGLFERREKDKMDLCFSNICLSGFEGQQESSSQKSYIKELLDMEQTAAPFSAFSKRKISDFTTSAVVNRTLENHSQVQHNHLFESNLNQIRSEVNLHIDSKNATPMKQNFPQRDYQTEKYLQLDCQNHQNYSLRRLSTPKDHIVRASSAVNIARRQSLTDHKEQIQQEYDQQMAKYKRFKLYLKQKRQHNIKEIEKNQQTLKKLIVKYEKSKEKTSKLRISLKGKQSNEKHNDSLIKKSKKQTPLKLSIDKNQNKVQSKRVSPSKKKKQESYEQQQFYRFSLNREEGCSQDKWPVAMDVYYQYVNQKKIMESQKTTPHKTTPRKGNMSQKKKDQKQQNSAVQRSILSISKSASAKEPRVNVKVDLVKYSGRRTNKGGQKEKLRLVSNNLPKPRQKIPIK